MMGRWPLCGYICGQCRTDEEAGRRVWQRHVDLYKGRGGWAKRVSASMSGAWKSPILDVGMEHELCRLSEGAKRETACIESHLTIFDRCITIL